MFCSKWKSNKLFLSCLVLILSFLYVLPMSNKVWHSYDEGSILVKADLVYHGKIPYKDFWTEYTPGQFYLLALLFKIFGKSLIVGRIYTIVLHSLICLMVFLITAKLCRLRFAILSCLICMVSLVPRLGPIPSQEWPAILFALLSLMTLLSHIRRQNYLWLMLTGFLVSLVFLFRQDFGIYTSISIAITVFFLSISTYSPKTLSSIEKLKKVLLESTLFLAPIFVVLSLALYYFAENLALSDLFHQLFYFPLEIYPQTYSISFPKFCFNPNMLFHQSMYFMTVNQFYIPIFILLAMFSLLVVRMFKQRRLLREDFILVAIFLTGFFHLNYVRVRSDIMHLIPTMPFFLILFGFLVSGLYETAYFHRHKYLRKAIATFVFIFMACFCIKNMDKYMKMAYTKVFYGKIVPVKFKLGTVYIPKQDARSIEQVVSFVRNNTADTEKIFVGNSPHVETRGNDAMIYFLSERLSTTKYHMFGLGITDQAEIQKEIVESIKQEASLIVLADAAEPKQINASGIISPLDNYIKRELILIKSFGPYSIYRKKG